MGRPSQPGSEKITPRPSPAGAAKRNYATVILPAWAALGQGPKLILPYVKARTQTAVARRNSGRLFSNVKDAWQKFLGTSE